ncbi:MAG: DUF6569 family protein [Hyphomicrobiaceae bacterium]|nr:DUF6569 family protein [Hyphomicrobiaceae bacterium]
MAYADPAPRISEPKVHENLAIYLVHGPSAPGPVPLTLQEAIVTGKVVVNETGNVNELTIENTGASEIFIQAGDIVKGGKQDRVLTVSMVLQPSSGKVPIASYCVEQGRWTGRGKEDVARFNSANEAMPSRSALLAMVAPAKPAEPAREAVSRESSARRAQAVESGGSDTSTRQRKVWTEVARTQDKLRSGLGGETVAAAQSATSLQLSLENDKLKSAREAYIKALQPAGESGDDIVGYIVAINGEITSANVYPSNGLFRKMWAKQLAASVTEAIGERDRKGPEVKPAPQPHTAEEFLAAAEKGKAEVRATLAGMQQETRDADKSLYNETKRADGRWIYRNYLAK